MYPPPHHQVNDRSKMIEVIKQYPLSMIVSFIDGDPQISHIPLIYNDDSSKLVGHMDGNNPQVESLQNGNEVKLVFKGPDTYISPSIYSTDQLPTWNYIIVHLKGTISVIDDPKTIKRSMVDMTRFLEAPDHKYSLDIDDPMMDRFMQYIHTFEIEITHWEGKFKLSQDKIQEDQYRAKEVLIEQSMKNSSLFIEYIYRK